MASPKQTAQHLARSAARQGNGPLYERDYWAAIDGCRVAPSRIGQLLAAHFTEFPPPDLVRFRRLRRASGALEVGDELSVAIRFAGEFRVRVIHRDENSLTLATLAGHPESGRITFGAYRRADGAVIFHIRSRARSSTGSHYAGFLTLGEAMQTNTWTDFIDRVAVSIGCGVEGFVHSEQRKVEDAPDDDAAAPTYVAKGD